MHVLMVVPYYPMPVVGGLERQAHLLAQRLIERGVKVTIISYTHDGTQKRQVRTQDGATVYEVGKKRSGLFSQCVVYLRYLRLLLEVVPKVDVVHVHIPSWFGALAIYIARFLRKPTLFKLSSVGVLGIPGLQRSWMGRIRLAVLLQAEGIVSMTEESCDELNAVGYPSEQVFFRPNGIELNERFHGRPEDEEIVRVVFVGRLSWEKRLPDLLEAWRLSRLDRSEAELTIVGDGPDRARLLELADELGVSSTVQFYGHSNDVSRILAKSHVFVLPSAVEGNSNAVLEAMRAGLPIVSTNISGTVLQVGPQGQELLFDVGDVATFSSILSSVIRDQDQRERFGAEMLNRINLFDMVRVAGDYHKAYASLVGAVPCKLNSVTSFVHH